MVVRTRCGFPVPTPNQQPRITVAVKLPLSAPQLEVPVEAVSPWWPVGQGQQRLYDLLVTFVPDGVDAGAPPGAPGSCDDAAGGAWDRCVEPPLVPFPRWWTSVCGYEYRCALHAVMPRSRCDAVML